jgi:hypothetical protein
MSLKRGLVMVMGALAIGAVGCASGGGSTAPAPAPEMGATQGALVPPTKGIVWIQVNADCTVDKEEAHISESKKEEAHWKLVDDPGPLGIEFKLAKGKAALGVAQVSDTETAATIKAKEYGPHAYRITIGDMECPDPVLIIDP